MAPLRDTPQRFDRLSIALHWLMAVAVAALFASGLWITGLDYYDPWYLRGPWWHKGTGMALFALWPLILLWRVARTAPAAIPTLRPWERRTALGAHRLMLALIGAVCLSGYLMVTAAGQPVAVFDRLDVPALITDLPGQEDRAGQAHRWLAWALIALAAVHATAAVKHHVLDRDATLRRMLGLSPPR